MNDVPSSLMELEAEIARREIHRVITVDRAGAERRSPGPFRRGIGQAMIRAGAALAGG